MLGAALVHGLLSLGAVLVAAELVVDVAPGDNLGEI